MRRVCTLKKVFNDGGKTIIEFVEVSPNKCREVKREIQSDGNANLSIYNNLTEEQIQRDIAMYLDFGYDNFE